VSAKRLLMVAIFLAAALPSWAASQPNAERDNKAKPPPKKTPPKPPPPPHHTMHHQQTHQVPHLTWPWLNVRMPVRPFYPMPFFPTWGVPLAGLMPGYTPPTTPDSMSGNQKEIVLDLAKTASVQALRPSGGYQPTKVDALKADQTVAVLVRSADKPATWTLVGKVISFEAGDPSQLTILARLDPGQAEFDPKGKLVTAVTIRNTPAVAQK